MEKLKKIKEETMEQLAEIEEILKNQHGDDIAVEVYNYPDGGWEILATRNGETLEKLEINKYGAQDALADAVAAKKIYTNDIYDDEQLCHAAAQLQALYWLKYTLTEV